MGETESVEVWSENAGIQMMLAAADERRKGSKGSRHEGQFAVEDGGEGGGLLVGRWPEKNKGRGRPVQVVACVRFDARSRELMKGTESSWDQSGSGRGWVCVKRRKKLGRVQV